LQIATDLEIGGSGFEVIFVDGGVQMTFAAEELDSFPAIFEATLAFNSLRAHN